MNKDAQGRWKVGMSNIKLKMGPYVVFQHECGRYPDTAPCESVFWSQKLLILYGQIILTSPMIGIMMSLMRTTLTIDPDVERLLQHEIRRTDKSLKAVVNDALRLGLGMQGKPPRGSRYKVNPHPFAFKPGVDVDRLNQLVDELEADELARQRTR